MDEPIEDLKPPEIRLRNLPTDIWELILDRKCEISKKTNNHCSNEKAIFSLIRQMKEHGK